MFIYSTGTRISECVNIKVTDIDSKRMQINIQEGKGLKQRKVPLSPVLLKVLRRYYKQYKPQYYLFEGAGGLFIPILMSRSAIYIRVLSKWR